MDLSIIIVNYNVYDELINCIKSIYYTVKDINFEIIVVDNNSTQSSVRNLNSEFKDVKLILQENNTGFAAANNTGVKNSTGKFLLILNPDTVVKMNFITPIIRFLETAEYAGSCSPMLLNEDNSYQTSSGFRMGVIYEFLEAAMILGIFRMLEKRRYLKLKGADIHIKTGWLSAACLILNKSAFEHVNGFSEKYFLNYEDIDLCRKLNDAGYINYYFPGLTCIHLEHKSFNENYEKLVLSRYKSRLVFAGYHYNFFSRAFIRLVHISGLLSRLALVNFLYSGIEKQGRASGYKKALKLYLGLNS